MKVFVIAEMGSSWLYSAKPKLNLQRGLKLMQIAADCNANAVKVQWVSDPLKMAKRRKMAGNPYQRLAWPLAWHAVLAEEAHRLKLEYLSTVFIPDDVPTLLPFVDRYKIASLECLSRSLWCEFSHPGSPVIVSCGCLTMAQVERVSDYCANSGGADMLQCTAAYPVRPEEVQLRCEDFDGRVFDGLSDHSGHVLTGAVAVGAGATILEVHCKLDETPSSNADFKHSHSPARLKQYIDNVRLAEMMLGDGKKRIMPSERPLMRHRVRR